MAIPNTFTNGTTADADEVNENFVEVYTPKASGIIHQTATSYGTDYVDVSFAASELKESDSIIVEILPSEISVAPSTPFAVFVKPVINDVTTPVNCGEMDFGTVGNGGVISAKQIISSHRDKTDAVSNFIDYSFIFQNGTNLTAGGSKTADTGESLPLTTAFTLRIDTKKASGTENTIRYNVYIRRGYS